MHPVSLQAGMVGLFALEAGNTVLLATETSNMSGTVQISTAVISLIGTIFTGYMAYAMMKLQLTQKLAHESADAHAEDMKAAAKKTADKVEEAGKITSEKVEEVRKSASLMAGAAAKKVDMVKEDLAASTLASNEKMAELKDVADKTHVLVNSNFGEQLHLHMMMARRMAELTRQPADIEASTTAARLYKEHMDKQKKADDVDHKGEGGVIKT